MAIRRIDPGLGDGGTGMDNWTRSKNTDENFQDPTNAASKLVGTGNGQVPLVEHVKTIPSGSVINQNTGLPLKIWKGTTAQYNAIVTKDPNTFYIKD